MFKKFFLAICLNILFFSAASAEVLPDNLKVAVMDLGYYKGAVTSDLNSDNIGFMVSDYVIEALVASGKFQVISKELVEEKFAEEKISTVGIIPPSVAKKIGKILGVKYIVYGNISGLGSDSLKVEILASGGKFHSVKATVILRIMDIETGSVIGMTSGDGVSKSSEIKISPSELITIKIGSQNIPQVAVHNSIKKAAYSSVAAMIEQLYGVKYKKIEELFQGKKGR